MSEMSTYEYVGLPRPDNPEALDVLPEVMSAIELESLLSGVNRESSCVLLGLMSDKPTTSVDIHEQFARYGLPDDGYIDTSALRQTLQRMPDTLVKKQPSGYSLTPFGKVAQGAAGHFLAAALTSEVPQLVVLSNNSTDIDSLEGLEGLTHIKRLFLLDALLKAGAEGMVSADLRGLARQYTIGKGSYEATVYKLMEYGVVQQTDIRRGVRHYQLNPDHVPYIETVMNIITTIAHRDEAFLQQGRELARKIAHSADAPMLASRSILTRRYAGHDVMQQTHDEVREVLVRHGPLTIFELHPIIEERGVVQLNGIHSLRTTLGYIANHLAGCTWGVTGKAEDNRTNVWGMTSPPLDATTPTDITVG